MANTVVRPFAAEDYGSSLIAMAEAFSTWVTRREERIEFENSSVCKRTVRVDFDLSRWRNSEGKLAVPEIDGRYLVPLAAVLRSQHTTFSVVDEGNSLLPRLIAEEERLLTSSGIVRIAKQTLATECNESLAPSTEDYLRAYISSSLSDQEPTETEQARFLKSHRYSMPAIENARNTYLLLVSLKPEDGLRRVITYSFMEPMMRTPSEVGQRDRAPGVFSWSSKVASVGDCASYHFEVIAPPAIRVLNAELTITNPGPGGAQHVVPDDDRLETHAHVHIANSQPLSQGEFRCRLALFSAGLVRSAVASCWFGFVSIVAMAALIWLDGPFDFYKTKLDASSGTAFFLLLPGLTGPLLAATTNHSLTTQMQFPTRIVMWLSGISSFIAAAAVASGVGGVLRVAAFGLAGTGAFLCAVFVTKQYSEIKELR